MIRKHVFALILGGVAACCPRLDAGSAQDLTRVLPAPEYYVKQRRQLHLTAAQEQLLREAIQVMRRDLPKAEVAMDTRAEQLQAALADPANTTEELAHYFAALLAAENEVKTVRFQASLTARRMLTPAQWEQVRTRAMGTSSAAVSNPDRVRLQKKLETVRALAIEAYPAGPPAELRQKLVRLRDQIGTGHADEADRLFDELIAELKQRLPVTKR